MIYRRGIGKIPSVGPSLTRAEAQVMRIRTRKIGSLLQVAPERPEIRSQISWSCKRRRSG